MKGDFTRLSFRREKHYSSVRLQQGRVQLDADWDEQVDIQAHLDQTTTGDVVGACGAPFHPASEFKHFQIRGAGTDFEIAPGRIYVDGTLCENEDVARGSNQPNLFDKAALVTRADNTVAALPAPTGVYLAYLDVWQRHLTALDDSLLREVALNGPDTATRTQTIWQVRLQFVESDKAKVNCVQFGAGWTPPNSQTTGQLSARAEPSQDPGSECLVPPGAGFRRLENQLYRVEIHQGGALGTATFKWSRDNGTVVAQWLSQDPNDATRLTVNSAGRDAVLSFAGDQWVELTDDSRELQGEPGTLVQLDRVDGNVLVIKPATATGSTTRTDFPANPKVRRWDSTPTLTVEIPATNDGWIPLEDGVEVKFENGSFKSGDFWLIPARTLTADVEWPKNGSLPAPQPPGGIQHHFCALALIESDAATNLTVVSDCRDLFPPLTRLTSFFYVSGDGQEAMPGQKLPRPLQVGVANGQWPVPGARIRFTRTLGSGALQPGTSTVVSSVDGELIVLTAANGVAECNWQLDATTQSQQIEAALLDDDGSVLHLPIRFNANLSIAAQVAYDPQKCPDLANANVATVQDAIDQLCQGGGKQPGILVGALRLIVGRPLANDTNVAVGELIQGLAIGCKVEGGVDPDSINRATVFVTLEMPLSGQSVNTAIWGGPPVGFQPLILSAKVNGKDDLIVWQPDDSCIAWLNQVLAKIIASLPDPRVLAHLTLKGNFIWDIKRPDMYLDGEVFGVRKPGDPNVNLDLPSGDGRRGGDFEMWFWLNLQGVAGGGIGLIVNNHSKLTAAAARQALSLAINRQLLSQAGVLPSGYQIDANAPFNPDTAKKIITDLGLANSATAMFVGQTMSPIGKNIQPMLVQNAALNAQMTVFPDASIVDRIATAAVAGQQIDIVVGDTVLAQQLAGRVPDFFDGSLIRI